MAANPVMSYIERNTAIHRLTGTSKLCFFLMWSVASMVSFDTRLLSVMFTVSMCVFIISRVRFKEVRLVIVLALIFLLLNNIAVYIFAPQYGTEIYGSSHMLFAFSSHYTVTQEQLFYMLNMSLKIISVIPVALVFITCTNPSEFAASLNSIGISYRVGYAVALAFRYIPDIQRDFYTISQTQQARGIELSAKDPLLRRLKNSVHILLPLIMNSLNRIEVISNAMELRGFHKHRKRTWYMLRPIKAADVCVIICGVLWVTSSFLLISLNGGRFFNPWKA